MEPITRRQALRLGILGGLGVAVGGIGLSQTGFPWDLDPTAGSNPLREPDVLRSDNGVLQVELTAAHREVTIAGQPVRMMTYNGTVPGQTWRVEPGDRIEVNFTNELDSATNLHTHGLAVSPKDNGDNPFVSIEPGQHFDYRFEIPDDHPSGTFWYHPHQHGSVADQLFGGLYGAIIVGSDDVPVSRERMLIISDLSLTSDGQLAPVSPQERMMGREGDLVLVNGQYQPQLTARPRQRERWRIINACTSRYLRLELSDQQVELLGIDTSQAPTPQPMGEVTLAPGNRADLLVTTGAGTSTLRSVGYDRGGMGMMASGDLSGPATLATLTVAGEPDASPAPVPARPAASDLRNQPIAAHREIAFSMTMGAMMRSDPGMGFDGRSFDADRVDQHVSAGTVEEWLITNPTPMDHPFHLHVWPMQLIKAQGHPFEEPTWRDVVNVPAQGHVRVLIDFARHSGRSVYHCHILDHEDAGMMASVEVL